MARVLLVGWDPDSVDFSDPALPPGMTAEKIRAGVEGALEEFAERGWEADVGYIRPDETAGPTVVRLLASATYDCVVGRPWRQARSDRRVVGGRRALLMGGHIRGRNQPSSGRWLQARE
jgi:hypothetical protein